jgi:hypothetical protein
MGWATEYIRKLQAGETVSFRPRGNSMMPKIKSGQLCTVRPVGDAPPKVGDVVLCYVAGNEYLHNVSDVRGIMYQISNNHGRINGWAKADQIFGVLIAVAD